MNAYRKFNYNLTRFVFNFNETVLTYVIIYIFTDTIWRELRT